MGGDPLALDDVASELGFSVDIDFSLPDSLHTVLDALVVVPDLDSAHLEVKLVAQLELKEHRRVLRHRQLPCPHMLVLVRELMPVY